jgi:hypothetical protein
MSKLMQQVSLACAAVIGIVGIALAENDNDDNRARTCSNATLQGLFVFSASGFNLPASGALVPKAIVEFIRFDGHGGLTVPAATANIGGTISRSPPGGLGSYSVMPDCTGTLAFGPPGPTFDIFVSPRGDELVMQQTSQPSAALFVLQGTAVRYGR